MSSAQADLLFLLMTLIAGESGALEASDRQPAWAYAQPEDGHAWARLSEDYVLCGAGKHQSPIRIDTPALSRLPRLVFDYRPVLLGLNMRHDTLLREGRKVGGLLLGPEFFSFERLTFRWPGEHMVGGQSFIMEAQLLHRSEEGHIAIVSVPLQLGAPNEALDGLLDQLVVPQEDRGYVFLNPRSILPDDPGYFLYEGSLTEPPCTEGVVWLVIREPQEVSERQVQRFQNLNGYNARKPQGLNNRIVLQE